MHYPKKEFHILCWNCNYAQGDLKSPRVCPHQQARFRQEMARSD
jgi:hypothetical protein